MSSLRIDVSDLLSHPGTRRAVVCEDVVSELGTSVAEVRAPVRLDLLLERVPEGIVVRGTVAATWAGECTTCLRDLSQTLTLPVDELFEATPLEGETYPIEGHIIDVEQLVRDTVLLDLPLAPRCEPPCPPLAVADGDVDDEDAAEPDGADPRWAALSGLDL